MEQDLQDLNDLGGQAGYPAPAFAAHLGRHNAVQSAADGLLLVVDEHGSVVVKADRSAVWPENGLLGAHNDSATDIAALHFLDEGAARGIGRHGEWSGTLHYDCDFVACMHVFVCVCVFSKAAVLGTEKDTRRGRLTDIGETHGGLVLEDINAFHKQRA